MPIYAFWGDDDHALALAVARLRDRAVASAWRDFNDRTYPGDRPETIAEALNEALTPPFGSGQRFVLVKDAVICQQCPPDLLERLERALPAIPAATVLVFVCSRKPDGRLKSTKLLKSLAEFREFAAIPPWKTEALLERVRELAPAYEVCLTPAALELLSAAVGSDTRQLHTELAKLALYGQAIDKPIDPEAVDGLVRSTTQTSLKLAEALREGDRDAALSIVSALLARNEPPLKITAVLVGQFRMWLALKLAAAAGIRDDRELAAAAEIANPKRLFFLRQQLQHLSGQQLAEALPILLDLELALKRGAPPQSALQAAAIALCQTCTSRNVRSAIRG